MQRFAYFVLIALVLAPINVAADMSQTVQQTFDGQIVVADDPLRHVRHGAEAEVIESLERARRAELAPTYVHADTAHWQFSFIAFLARPARAAELSLEVYDLDSGTYVTSERLLGIEPGVRILVGEASLSEDDGLTRGVRYRLELTAKWRGRDVVLAQTALVLR